VLISLSSAGCAAPPEDSECDRPPRIGFQVGQINDEAYELLLVRTGWRRAEAASRFSEETYNRFARRSPRVELSKLPGGAERAEYTLTANLSIISAKGEIGFWMSAKLTAITSCKEGFIADIELAAEKDFIGTIQRVVDGIGDLRARTDEYESRPNAPLRSPSIRAKTEEEETVSAAEDRTLTHVRAELLRCDGTPAGPHRRVFFPREGKRGELEPSEGWGFAEPEATAPGYMAVWTNGGGTASADYTLKRGIGAGADSLELMACALGVRAMAVSFVEVPINGLGVEVKPAEVEIDEADNTDVVLEVFEVERSGDHRPVPNAPITLTIDGLIDGNVEPSKVEQVDENGRATLRFEGGRKDETVTFKVKYQPEGFTDFVEGSGSVTVLHTPDVTGEVVLRWNTPKLFEGRACVNGRASEGQPVRLPFHLEKTDNRCRYDLVPDGTPGPVEYRNTCSDIIPFLGDAILYEEIGSRTARFAFNTPWGVPRLDYDATAVATCDTGQPLKVLFAYNTLHEIDRTTVRGEVKETEGRSPGWHDLHCNSWAIQDGLHEEVGVFAFELRLDAKSYDALRERCERSRR
jgi:hypothetical protein